MATDRQLAANRRNAQLSTGPTTPTGKSHSSMNALKSGIHAKSLLIKGESLEELESLKEEIYAEYQPATTKARLLADELIRCDWTLRRLAKAEAQLWDYDRTNYSTDNKNPLGRAAYRTASAFTRLQWRMDQTRRLSTAPSQASTPSPKAAPHPIPSHTSISPQAPFLFNHLQPIRPPSRPE